MLENLRSQRYDLHEILRAQLAGNRAEDARAARVVRRIDDDDLRLIMAAFRAPVLSATSRMERSWIMAGFLFLEC
jgi:hypothetical protein